MDFGAFIEILPGKEGLCHISRLSATRVKSVSDVVKEGQEVQVKVMEIDSLGRINLCHVDALGSESANKGSFNRDRNRKPSSSHYRDQKRDRPRES